MKVRTSLVALVLICSCGVSHGREDRWSNFAEDADLKYYLDQESVSALPDNVYTFWVKSVAKDKDYYKKEYKLTSLAQILTSYELDCAVASYRVRGVIMLDRNRREIAKSMAAEGEGAFEPVPPESVLELIQNELCVGEEAGAKQPEADEAGGGEEDATEKRGAQAPREQPPADDAAPVPSADPAVLDSETLPADSP